MKCNHCNSEVADGTNFCPSCGNRIDYHSVNNTKKKSPTNWKVIVAAILALIVIGGGIFYKKNSNNREKIIHNIGSFYDIDGNRYLSFEQMKYIADNKFSNDEIDEYFTLCGFNKKSEKTDVHHSSEFEMNDVIYRVSNLNDERKSYTIEVIYKKCRSKNKYLDMLISDFEDTDTESIEKSKGDETIFITRRKDGYFKSQINYDNYLAHIIL